MMRFIIQRRRIVRDGSISYFPRGGAGYGSCLEEVPSQKIGDNLDDHGGQYLSFSQRLSPDYKGFRDSLHKQVMPSSCSGSIFLQRHSGHSSITGLHVYSEVYAHAICQWQCRDFCTIASQEPADLNHEVGSADASKAAWETLTSQMQDLQGGLAKGKALEALKGLVDLLEPIAEPTDLRLGLACVRVAQSLAAAGEEASKYLSYAQRALKCLETLQGSWEHALCLFILGSAYVELEKFDIAVSQLEQCVSVLQQRKGTMRDDRYFSILLSVHHVLGQVENLQGNYDKSLLHYEHALRVGKKAFKEGSPKLATLYYQAGMVCRQREDPKVALCFAEKALEGFMTCYGPSSLQVGKVRALTSGIHCDLQKYEEALSDYKEAKPILEYLKETEELARMNLDIAKLLLNENKYEDALPLLEEVIKSTDVTSKFHVNALISAANASSELKLEVAADYCQKAMKALGHQETSRITAYNLTQLGLIVEKRAEFERAAALFQRALKMIDECSVRMPCSALPEDKTGELQLFDKVGLMQLEDKIGMLLLQAGRVRKAIPYFESSLKDAESGNGIQLFNAHLKLGKAYSLLNQKLEASHHFKACNAVVTEWFRLYVVYGYYHFAANNRSIDNMGLLENMGICFLWLFV